VRASSGAAVWGAAATAAAAGAGRRRCRSPASNRLQAFCAGAAVGGDGARCSLAGSGSARGKPAQASSNRSQGGACRTLTGDRAERKNKRAFWQPPGFWAVWRQSGEKPRLPAGKAPLRAV
jgi:hypothetical protein